MRIRCACIYNNVVEVTTTAAMIGKPIVCVPLSRSRVPIMRSRVLSWCASKSLSPCTTATATMENKKKKKKGAHTHTHVYSPTKHAWQTACQIIIHEKKHADHERAGAAGEASAVRRDLSPFPCKILASRPRRNAFDIIVRVVLVVGEKRFSIFHFRHS